MTPAERHKILPVKKIGRGRHPPNGSYYEVTSFSVCLQCVFACTIGSGKPLKWNWPFAALGPRLPCVKRQSRAAGLRASEKGRCSKWHPYGSKLLNRIFDMCKS